MKERVGLPILKHKTCVSLQSALTHSNKTSPQLHQDKGGNGERGGRSLSVDVLTWTLERMHFLGPKWDLLQLQTKPLGSCKLN